MTRKRSTHPVMVGGIPTKLDTVLSGVDPATGAPFTPKGRAKQLHNAVDFVMDRLSEQAQDDLAQLKLVEISQQIEELAVDFLTEQALDANRTSESEQARDFDSLQRAARILARVPKMCSEAQEAARAKWPASRDAGLEAPEFLRYAQATALPSETSRRAGKQNKRSTGKQQKTWTFTSRHWLIERGQKVLEQHCGPNVAALETGGDLEDFIELLWWYATGNHNAEWDIAKAIRQIRHTRSLRRPHVEDSEEEERAQGDPI